MVADPAGVAQAPPDLVLSGSFSPQLRIYLLVLWTIVVVCTVAGIVLLPVWAVVGPIWVRRYHAALRCDLTERSVIIARGLIFRRELTIPLDKIQDISIREGPLLSAFGLLQLRIETAGQSSSPTGTSDADLTGLVDARAVRDRILAQRDLLYVLTVDQIGQTDAAEEFMDLLTEVAPQVMGQAGIAGVTTPEPLATGGIDRFVDRVDNLSNLDTGHVARQLITSARPAHTGDETPTAKLGKQLLEIGKRNSLALGNVGQGNRPMLRMQRKIKHGGNGITAFGGQSHRSAPSITVWRNYAIPEYLSQL